MGIKIVHTSDLHLGINFNHLKGRAQEERQNDFFTALKDIVEYIKSEKGDILLITGNLFDTILPPSGLVVECLNLFKRVPDTKVFIIPGIRDADKAEGKYPLSNENLPENVKIFTSWKFENVSVKLDGFTLEIYGKAYNPLKPGETLTDTLPRPSGDINIALLFANVPQIARTSPCLPLAYINLQSSALKKYTYVALGGSHEFKIHNLDGTYLVYPGNPEALGFADLSDKGFVSVTIKELPIKKKDIKFIKRKCRKLIECKVKFNIKVTNIADKILSALPRGNKNAILKISLVGDVLFDVYRKFDKKEIESLIETKYFGGYIENNLNIIELDESVKPLRDVPTIQEEYERLLDEKISNLKKSDIIAFYKEVKRLGLNEISKIISEGEEQ